MSSIIKVFLLLAVVVCLSSAQRHKSGQCLCQRIRDRIVSKSDIKDIQIYQATTFCNKVEIVVTNNSGLRYCLNPNLDAVKKIMASIISSSSSSSSTARN
ncbi:C-X-C motif chemokine 11-like isoform X2 [Centropristis striata]|uniref:C-X-C motif chemokine 11-like isoform X2 n=1 Tax=Centropristis striata TaxID=184440 RepID=UPI0027E17EB6|nr:C-X-C motif chemokine 11-like isoform X2 [Centropristis striata]